MLRLYSNRRPGKGKRNPGRVRRSTHEVFVRIDRFGQYPFREPYISLAPCPMSRLSKCPRISAITKTGRSGVHVEPPGSNAINAVRSRRARRRGDRGMEVRESVTVIRRSSRKYLGPFQGHFHETSTLKLHSVDWGSAAYGDSSGRAQAGEVNRHKLS
jgi:hypothetical protein